MTPVVKSIALSSGVTLCYAEQGDPAGVPVLFLHGFTDSWRSFEPVLPHVPASIRAVALTQRGHGDGDRPATGYRTRDFAADVAEVVETLGLAPVVIVGHSMGSTNAQRFAIDHPAGTRGLVLAATFGGYRSNPVIAEFWQSGIAPLVDPIDPAFVREFQETTLAQPVSPAFIDMVVQESVKVPARVWRAAFEGFLEDDVAHDLHRITAPTLVLCGARDAFVTRADQDALGSAVAGPRLVIYERAGHALHWEEPERFASDVVAFVESLTGDEGR